MNPTQKSLLLQLVKGIISKDEFIQISGVDRKTVCLALEDAFERRSAFDVEYAMLAGFNVGFSDRCGAVLSKLIMEDWHTQHEDMASALQELPSLQAIDSLYRAATVRLPYLEFDKAYALAIKCVYALYFIGTEDAKKCLVLLSGSDKFIIAENAIKLLTMMEQED